MKQQTGHPVLENGITYRILAVKKRVKNLSPKGNLLIKDSFKLLLANT